MKSLKLGLLSFFIGVVVSVVPITVYAACAQQITFRDANNCRIEWTCDLIAGSESCSDGVCVCGYICQGCGHLTDGPCPEEGPSN